MDLLFLGTSSGTPTRARNVSGLGLLEENGKGWYLIDCGEATQHQVLRTPLSPSALRAIFITHVHGDHCFGLPGLLASAALQGRKTPLEIIAPRGIEAWLSATFVMSQTYLPYPLVFHAVETLQEWRTPRLRVRCTALSHRSASFAYRFEEARPDTTLDLARLEREIPRGPLWGQLARGFDAEHDGRLLRSEDYLLPGRPPRVIVVGGDNDTPELLADACRDAQVLVHEATFTKAAVNETRGSFGHSTAAAVAAFAQEAGVPNLVLTHFSARYQHSPGRGDCITELHDEARALYPGTLFLAEDFLHLRLNKEGALRRVMG